uniref:Charged multivesicular body protein 7 n=1 Tax=Chaetoceros debilis TaxID=122233 RepID=A0A7S3VA48_9STRA
MSLNGNSNSIVDTPATATSTSDLDEFKYYAAAGQVVAMEIQSIDSDVNVDIVQKDTNVNVPPTSGTTKKVFAIGSGLSKRFFNKASTAMTSILASYDLAESDPCGEDDDDDYNDNDDYNDDDAFAKNVNVESETLEDVDDAYASGHGQDHQSRTTTNSKKQNDMNANKKCNIMLTELDVVYNTELIIDCWRIILNCATLNIKLKANDDGISSDGIIGIGNGCEHAHNNIHEDQIMGGKMFFNRFGGIDDPYSFLSFCHEAAESIDENEDTDRDTDTSSVLLPGYHRIASILKSLSDGKSVEIIIAAFIATKKAQFSSTSSKDDTLILIPGKEVLAVDGNQIEKSLEIDAAIFKLATSIKSMERRMNNLEKQSDEARRRALRAKQDGNKRLALMFLQRHKLYAKEIDRCSTTLLNLDQGIHSLKRARSDAEVLKTYELVGSVLKDIRQNTDMNMDQVDSVMEAYTDNLHEASEVSSALGLDGFSEPINNVVDEDKMLEEELQDLMNDDANDDETLKVTANSDETLPLPSPSSQKPCSPLPHHNDSRSDIRSAAASLS